MKTPESLLKEDLKKYLDEQGIMWFMVPGRAGGTLGAPDIITCVDGLFVGIEAKTPTGKFSGWQITRKAQIEASGGIDLFIRSTEQLVEAIEELRRNGKEKQNETE